MENTSVLPAIGTGTANEDRLTPQFHVVLLDDDDHTYDYVIEMLQKLFLYSKADAFRRAVEVDTLGRTIVITCELPQAEFARDQIHSFGADPRMPRSEGSMRAVIEPAAGGSGA
jgi:ATP-dependent Clp protease adaptor protein ClpS